MLFLLRRRQAVHRLRLALRGVGAVLLPLLPGLEGHHSQRRHAAVLHGLAAHLARLLVAQQQPHGACGQCATTSPRQQAAKLAGATAGLTALARIGAAVARECTTGGLQQLIKQPLGIHSRLLIQTLRRPA